MATKGVRTVKTELHDTSPVGRRKERKLAVVVKMTDAAVELLPDGYGSPVLLQFHDGKLQLLVFGEAGTDEPTQTIDLESAATDPKPG
jgi:hypothetical protein